MNSGGIDMTRHQSTTQTMKISEVRGQLNSLVNQVYRRETRVVVEKSGIPVAGIVSVDDLKRLDQLDKQHEADLALVDELRNAFQDVPDEEIERETDRALNRARDEMRSEQVQVTGKS
jgi:prevent-host-death family protein